MSRTFNLSGTSSVLYHNCNPPIELEDNYVLGLVNLLTFNSFPNIDSSNNKFYFMLENGRKASIEIPEGSYEIDNINTYLNTELVKVVERENQIKNNQIFLPPSLLIHGNNNTLKCEIKCTLDIDFSKNDSIASLLGFTPKKLKRNRTYTSDFPCKILSLNTLCVECNIVSNSYRNGKEVHVIHQFFPSVPPGYKIIETPSNVIYLPINTKQIDEIVIKITDEKGKLVNFRGEDVTVILNLKRNQ
jgi:hypothetical protein